ncbi:hypothetical protein FEE95_06285 [Maribacter algarum]|uniref:Uncharacterized protein n=1 Tax=Maribacter algarum (ex Zhang et al. 2020) TaxID=2578118 RepID=A0A5S3PVV5_9FLAO|nr:hypothetical protein [Maribacter algarum]TMM59038.1 hypothetical protein FEE95_06285 [Maribacter algarum]
MVRKIISVVLGLASAVLIFLIAEKLNASMHPFPKTLDFSNSKAVKEFFDSQPFLFWLIVLLAWAIGSFICGLVIKIVGKSNNKVLAYVAGGILTLSGIANIFSLPHPTWFIVVGLLIFVPFVLAGHRVFKLKMTENDQQ